MLQRREDRREPPGPIESAPSGVPSRPAVAPETDPRIEDYLDQIYASLVGWVPYEARAELRAELQAHLASRVAAYQELGSSPDAAVREALAQSGDPRVVAGEWVREWERILPPRKAPSAWRSLLIAVGCFGLATNLALALCLVAQSSGITGQFWGISLYTVLGAVLPFLAGLTTGLLSPIRAARATVFALVLLIPPTTLALPWLLRYTPVDVALVIGWLQTLFWIPIGSGAATLGSRLRARRDETPREWLSPA